MGNCWNRKFPIIELLASHLAAEGSIGHVVHTTPVYVCFGGQMLFWRLRVRQSFRCISGCQICWPKHFGMSCSCRSVGNYPLDSCVHMPRLRARTFQTGARCEALRPWGARRCTAGRQRTVWEARGLPQEQVLAREPQVDDRDGRRRSPPARHNLLAVLSHARCAAVPLPAAAATAAAASSTSRRRRRQRSLFRRRRWRRLKDWKATTRGPHLTPDRRDPFPKLSSWRTLNQQQQFPRQRRMRVECSNGD